MPNFEKEYGETLLF